MRLSCRLLLVAALLFTVTLGIAAEDKPSTKASGVAGKVATGIFLGIEQGDYAHWKMRTDRGDELSLFILRPDAALQKVLSRPRSYKGRKCRVTWRRSIENIPEAGGRIEIEQILGVEWLGGK